MSCLRCGDGQRAHIAGTGAPQHLRAFIQRRPGRSHIVDEDHDLVLDGCPWHMRECAADVCRSGCGVERHLRRRRARTPQGVDDGTIEPLGEIARLIETAPQPPPWMQRHRHDAVTVVEHRSPSLAHEAHERIRKRPSPFVLECVNDVAERTLISAASDADADVGAGPGCERRRNDAAEARSADAAARRRIERRVTGGARGRERRGEKRVYACSENSCRSAFPQRRSSS